MSDFIERLEKENAELEEKIDKLEAFIDSEKFDDIEPIQMSLLHIQLQAMLTYHQCLINRIIWLEECEECEEETKDK